MTNPVQPLDPAGAPPAVTPADSPSNPAGYAQVTPSGRGPAPYDIQAPMEDLAAAVTAAGNLTGAGVNIYSKSDRQSAAQHIMESPAGFDVGGGVSGWDIQQGFSGSGDDDMGWPNNVQPPVQEGFIRPGTYPGTTQGGIGLDDYSA